LPELPEVETVMRGLRGPLEGRRILRTEVRVPGLRWPFPGDLVERLSGRRVEHLERRAKYILVYLEGAEALMVHLGMSGRMVVLPLGSNRPPEKHDHVVFHTDEGMEIRFNDARRFGMLDLVAAEKLATHRLLRDLGPEPLTRAFDGAYLSRVLTGKSAPIKAALLDQRLVAGIGNIYACEALFIAGISPKRLARNVPGRRAEALAAAVKEVLTRAIEAGGSSLRDYVQSDGELGYFQHQWAVYGRAGAPCPGCDSEGGVVMRVVQSGRSTFYCPRCQR